MTAPRALFVTGTDTGVGKTLVSAALLHALRTPGRSVAGMKPVASGCIATAEGLRNADALLLASESSAHWPYAVVNPCAYEPPIAPHLAAHAAGRPIDFEAIANAYATLSAGADHVVVEGAGGWRAPLDGRRTVGDLAARLGLPVILVVGLRLGCLNHALLTAEGIAAQGLPLAGWVANDLEPAFAARAGNVQTLRAWLPAPCLGEVPWLSPPVAAEAARKLDLSILRA